MDETLIRKRDSYRRDLTIALDRIVKSLKINPEVQKVILFGSFAEGRSDLFTDLDLLVIMNSKDDFVTRTAELYASLNPGVDLDLLVYTPLEFNHLNQKSFLKNALKDGLVLYEKE